MSAPGGSPIVARMRLGSKLKTLRHAAGITGERAAAAIHSSSSKISRLEGGLLPVRERDVEALLSLYGGAGAAERAELLALARESSSPGWWDTYSEAVPPQLRHCLEMEAGAHEVRIFDYMAVPAMLHTNRYALAAATAAGLEGPRWRGGMDLRTLAHRRELHASAHAPSLWAVIGQGALSHGPSDEGVMAEQIAHLIRAAQMQHVTLQILPSGAPQRIAAAGPFSVLRFAAGDLPDAVMLELLTAITCLERRRDVERYEQIFTLLATAALTPEDSLGVLEGLAQRATGGEDEGSG